MASEDKGIRRRPVCIVLMLDDSASMGQNPPGAIDKNVEDALHDYQRHRGVIKGQQMSQPQRRRDVVG